MKLNKTIGLVDDVCMKISSVNQSLAVWHCKSYFMSCVNANLQGNIDLLIFTLLIFSLVEALGKKMKSVVMSFSIESCLLLHLIKSLLLTRKKYRISFK